MPKLSRKEMDEAVEGVELERWSNWFYFQEEMPKCKDCKILDEPIYDPAYDQLCPKHEEVVEKLRREDNSDLKERLLMHFLDAGVPESHSLVFIL